MPAPAVRGCRPVRGSFRETSDQGCARWPTPFPNLHSQTGRDAFVEGCRAVDRLHAMHDAENFVTGAVSECGGARHQAALEWVTMITCWQVCPWTPSCRLMISSMPSTRSAPVPIPCTQIRGLNPYWTAASCSPRRSWKVDVQQLLDLFFRQGRWFDFRTRRRGSCQRDELLEHVVRMPIDESTMAQLILQPVKKPAVIAPASRTPSAFFASTSDSRDKEVSPVGVFTIAGPIP